MLLSEAWPDEFQLCIIRKHINNNSWNIYDNSHTPRNLVAASLCFRVLFFLGRTVYQMRLIQVYFTNIGPKLASKINNINRKNFATFLPPYFHKSLFLSPTDKYEILKIVKALKSSRSTGHDCLSVNLLQKIIVHITSPLTHIFNLSISAGKCPNSLKIAKVIPVFKKDDPSLLTNYRPISLLPSISKILEKIIYKRLYFFLNVNNLLIPNQFGFRKGHSTDYAIIHFTR